MKDLLNLLDGTVKTVRRISAELRPSLLDDLGLIAAMEWQLNEFEKRSDIKTTFIVPEEETELPNNVKTGLFRIFQESLTNVVRHSNAKKLLISLKREEGSFILSIQDDGIGFDKQKVADKNTLGILGMRERALMIDGTYDIISTPGKGTTVFVAVPLHELIITKQVIEQL
jgi:signal transduction histidine kinase